MAIAQKAAQCALSLEGILQAAPTEDARQEWENQIFRFNLWSANNFVFAPIRASMDWRLRNAPLLESSMCELLEDLQSALIRHAAIMKTANHQGKTDRDNSVSDTLEDLFRLSRAIRRSGILRRFVKIESYIEFDENGVNLTDEFRKGVERLLAFRLKDSPASQILRERVVNTICLRQQHFAYLRAKWENGTVRPAANSPAPVQPRSSLGATFSVRGSIASSPSPDKKKEGVSIPTIMTATTAQPERVKLARSIKSAVSVEHEEFECNEEDLPLPPKVPPDAAEYECPFCYMVCPSSEFWGERWKKHIVQDIMPYFCVFDDCPTTNTLFESGRDWLRHMRERHVVTGWTCMDQSHGTTFIFDTQSRFKDHMYTCHTGDFADDELDDITAASHQRLAPHNLVTTCPFCPIDITASIPTHRMMDHVAKHMLSLARVSVSWQMEGESSDSQSSQQYLVVRNPGGHVPIPRSRSRRPLDMEMMNSEGYTVHRGGSFGKRLQEDFPSVDDENYDTDEEYAPDDGSLPEGDWEFFDTLWRDVRQELQLPPLGMETGNEASIPEVQQHVQRRDTGHEDPMEAGLYSASDQSVASSIISASYKPPGTRDSEYPQKDRYQEYHIERRVRKPSPRRPRVLRRQSSLDTFDRRPPHKVDDLGAYQHDSPRNANSPPPVHHRYHDDRLQEIAPRRWPSDEEEEDQMVPIRRRSRDNEEAAVNTRPYPRKGKTRFPGQLVDTRAIREYGYPYEQEGDKTIVKLALSKEQIDDLIERSREFKRSLEGRSRSRSRERDRSPPRQRSPGPLVFDTPLEGPDSKEVRSTTEHRPPLWRHSTKRIGEMTRFSGD